MGGLREIGSIVGALCAVARQLGSPRRARYALYSLSKFEGVYKRECPVCSYKGYFRAFGQPPRYDAKCRNCGSLERHRHFWLCENKHRTIGPESSILHIAPETQLESSFRPRAAEYITADLEGKGVDEIQDITTLTYDDERFDVVMAHHVLEHVPNDQKAIAEVYRVLKSGGMFIVSVPLIAAWNRTYENPTISSPSLKTVHFGQWDHVRVYGSDFIPRLEQAGFSVTTETAGGNDSARYGLIRGETIHYCRKVSQKA